MRKTQKRFQRVTLATVAIQYFLSGRSSIVLGLKVMQGNSLLCSAGPADTP